MRSEIILGKTMDLLLEKCERQPLGDSSQDTDAAEPVTEAVES